MNNETQETKAGKVNFGGEWRTTLKEKKGKQVVYCRILSLTSLHSSQLSNNYNYNYNYNLKQNFWSCTSTDVIKRESQGTFSFE